MHKRSFLPALWGLLLLVLLGGCATQPAITPPPAAQFQPGDLLFQDLDAGPLCDAIETVTEGYHHTRLSHVAMVISTTSPTQVIEASGGGVKVTPLETFLARSHDAAGHPKVIVGRLKTPYQPLIPAALAYAQAQTGKPYDKHFLLNENTFYCSGLIYYAFKHANHDTPLFATAPMTFKDPRTQDYFPAWTTYFHNLNCPIPQDQPGINPGGISRAPCLNIIYYLGQPDLK